MNELTVIEHVPIMNDVEALTDLKAGDLIDELERRMEPRYAVSPSMMRPGPVRWISSAGTNVEGENLAT